MRVLIVEDEYSIARYIQKLVKEFMGDKSVQSEICSTLTSAQQFLQSNEVDLLLLDLNLNGRDGFELLEVLVSAPYHIVIISANREEALRAFEYGVLDFIAKPFEKERLALALERARHQAPMANKALRFIAFSVKGKVIVENTSDVLYVKGARSYSEVYFTNQTSRLHNKSLDKLTQLLPDTFFRIHKSYVINLDGLEQIISKPGSVYFAKLKTGEQLPIGRTKITGLRSMIAH